MIASLSELKSYLWITDSSQDTILTIFLDSADDFVRSYIGREIESATYTEYFDGDGQREILMKNYPVTTLTSFEENTGTIQTPVWTAVDSSTYKLSPNIAKLFLTFYKSRGFQNFKVVYVAWYATIPGDIKLATLKLASGYYNRRTSDGIKSEGVAGDNIVYDTTEIPSDVFIILNNYRDV